MTTRNEKAPNAGQGVEGISSRKEPVDMSTTVRPRGKYSNYTVEVSDERSHLDVWYEDRGPKVLRVHYRVFRIPSKKKFVIKHLANATAADCAEVERLIPSIPRMFANWEDGGPVKKARNRDAGYYFWWVSAGSYVDDPIVQLELEMMIDNDVPVGEILRKADDLGIKPSTILNMIGGAA
ncbi:hypothetical protein V8Z69_07570 [Microbacterium aurugineum]|uniref:hypothetical protein n=2 Tax=Microbacterium aurugineum TaxID=2851642 RepID=UPI0039BECBF4